MLGFRGPRRHDNGRALFRLSQETNHHPASSHPASSHPWNRGWNRIILGICPRASSQGVIIRIILSVILRRSQPYIEHDARSPLVPRLPAHRASKIIGDEGVDDLRPQT